MKLVEAFEAFATHLLHERQCAPRTVEAYRADFFQFAAWLDQTLPSEVSPGKRATVRPNAMRHFTTERIRAWQAHLSLERHNGPASVRRKLHALASFANFLVKTGAIGENPLDGVTVPKPRIRVRQAFSQAALQAILTLPLSPRDATMRGVFVYAGLRLEEVVDLTVGALKLGPPQPALHIHGKGDAQRLVPIPPVLVALLMDYQLRTGRLGRYERVFQTDQGKPIHRSQVQAMVAKWGEQVGVHAHPHLFRHTYATGLAMTGMPIHRLKAYLGHRDIRTTDLYLHGVQTSAEREVLEAWAAGQQPVMLPAPPMAPMAR